MQPDGHGLDRWSVGPKRAGRVVRGGASKVYAPFFFPFPRSAVFLRDDRVTLGLAVSGLLLHQLSKDVRWMAWKSGPPFPEPTPLSMTNDVTPALLRQPYSPFLIYEPYRQHTPHIHR
jgi:hypothetical protein